MATKKTNHKNKELVVVIDDIRTHPDADVHLRTSQDALTWLRLNFIPVEELWLDHDLGGDDTIRPVVMWLAEQAHTGKGFPVQQIFVHSMNPVGAEWAVGTLQRSYNVRRRRFI